MVFFVDFDVVEATLPPAAILEVLGCEIFFPTATTFVGLEAYTAFSVMLCAGLGAGLLAEAWAWASGTAAVLSSEALDVFSELDQTACQMRARTPSFFAVLLGDLGVADRASFFAVLLGTADGAFLSAPPDPDFVALSLICAFVVTF
jgi:hypothetical protein